jgi:hypothetical protein
VAYGFEVDVRVAGGFGECAKEDDVALDAGAAEAAREGRAIAAVVAFTTEDKGAPARKVPVETAANRFQAGRARRFHQEQGGGVVVFDSETIDLTHLLSEDYRLHAGMIAG